MNVEPVYTPEELSKLNAVTPDVSGLAVGGAKTTLEKQNFTARIVGNGDKVISQYPVSGQSIPMNGVVVLYTDGENEAEPEKLANILAGVPQKVINRSALSFEIGNIL